MKIITQLTLFLLISSAVFSQTKEVVEDTAEVKKAFSLLNIVKEADRFIARLDSTYVIDLPVGIGVKNKKNSESYAIVISELKVREGKTFLTAYMAFTVPGTTKKVAFRGRDIPFSFEGGFEGPAKLDLVSDFDVPVTKNTKLILRGGGKTNVVCDCNGFKEMKLYADLIFDSTLFVPENPDGTLQKSKALTTTIETTITDWDDLIVAVSVEPFQLKGLTGIGFSITNATLDFSDKKNPEGIEFSEKHQSTFFIDGNPNFWQGIYIKDTRVRLPMQFRKKTAKELSADSLAMTRDTTGTLVFTDSVASGRINFYAQNLLIDDLGFTGKLGASRLMSLDEGDLGGWAFSVENFLIDIQASHLVAGSFNGQIYIPYFKQNSLFNYNANIGLNDTYSFSVATTSEIEKELWIARLRIDPNSALEIKVQDKKFLPSLMLNGQLSIDAPVNKKDSTSKKLVIAEIPFKGMKIQTVEPYFTVEQISYGVKQNLFSKFPVSINEIGFESQKDRFGLRLGLNVGFTPEKDGGFGGNGRFTVWGKKENDKWGYGGIDISKIGVNINKPGAFVLKGDVDFFRSDSLQGDTLFGDGFKGTLKAAFGPFGNVDTMGIQAIALFGNVKGDRYWFADALASLPKGIPAGPVSIYGFGGGACYHMKQIGIDEEPTSNLGTTLSDIIYKPDASSGLSLKASVKFGTTGSQKAFNGDLAFGISFTTSGGLNRVSLVGNGYFATNDFEVSMPKIMEKAKYIINKTEGEIKIPLEEENS